MATKKSKKKSVSVKTILSAIVIIVAIIVAWQTGFLDDLLGDSRETFAAEGTVELHVIDVGQGDSLLIRNEQGNILIDTGDTSKETENAVRNYLEEQNVKELEYLIITHYDADHIGAADMVLREYKVKRIIMPDVAEKDIPTTNVFNNMISALEASEDTEVISAVSGTTYQMGDLHMKVLAPNSAKYSEMNNYSVAIRFDFGKKSFLLTGDAEELSEKEMMKTYSAAELDCDLFKAAHHGSRGANSLDFLKKVTPDIVVISCGEGNKHEHPHAEALERFEQVNATVYRTDKLGSLVFVCDGKTITKK